MDSAVTNTSGDRMRPKRPHAHDLGTLSSALRERMRALVICLSHSWGGLEHIAANDSVDLGSLGCSVHVLCLEGSPVHEYLSQRDEVTTVPVDFEPRDVFDFRMRRVLHRLVDEQKVNLIHCHQPSLIGSISPWIWNRNVAFFVSRHIMNTHNKRGPYHSLIYRRVDALIAMSQTLKDNVLATHRLKERQLKVIHHGLDFELFDPERVDYRKQRADWGADDETIVIGMVGRIDPAKGQDTFIKAAAGLLKQPKDGERFKFVIVGEETLGRTSTYLDELKKMVGAFRISEHVIFAGYQENIPEVMAAFDIFVMPSRQEAFGLVAIEAMAMKCPIVISSGGSAREIVGNEEFGLLIRPFDAFDLQSKLRRLLEDPQERIQMGERAREHVQKNFERNARLRTLLEVYERVLRRRGL